MEFPNTPIGKTKFSVGDTIALGFLLIFGLISCLIGFFGRRFDDDPSGIFNVAFVVFGIALVSGAWKGLTSQCFDRKN